MVVDEMILDSNVSSFILFEKIKMVDINYVGKLAYSRTSYDIS